MPCQKVSLNFPVGGAHCRHASAGEPGVRGALDSGHYRRATLGAMRRAIKVGCCGFRSARAEYYALLPAVEVQHTFYQPPRLTTLAQWRAEAPPAFEFTLKAWQLITHRASSPTYRRLKRELSAEERDGAGSFRASEIVREAW